MRGDKECPFNGVTTYGPEFGGRVPESEVWSVVRAATADHELQALVYDVLPRPPTTAVFSYAIGSRKLSANEQFFVGGQTVVSLLQTTQIVSDVCFITDHVAYASSNKAKMV